MRTTRGAASAECPLAEYMAALMARGRLQSEARPKARERRELAPGASTARLVAPVGAERAAAADTAVVAVGIPAAVRDTVAAVAHTPAAAGTLAADIQAAADTAAAVDTAAALADTAAEEIRRALADKRAVANHTPAAEHTGLADSPDSGADRTAG